MKTDNLLYTNVLQSLTIFILVVGLTVSEMLKFSLIGLLVAISLGILFKILNLNNSPEKNMFYCSNQKFLDEFLKKAPELAEPYIPTRFWGYSGHLQTIIQVSGKWEGQVLISLKVTH